jgi:alpha-mannosidase
MATPVALPFNLDGVSADSGRADGDFDGKKHTIAAELLPAKIELNGVPFAFGSGAAGQKNVLVPAGQTLELPSGAFTRVYILAAAVGGDVSATFTAGTASKTFMIREWQGPVGQWWSRLTDVAPSLREPFAVANGNNGLVVQWDNRTGIVSGIDKIHPAFVKRDEIAWIGTHRHQSHDETPASQARGAGNEPYVSSYVFAYALDLPAGTRSLKLPTNDRLRILAVSVATESARATPAGPLYIADFPDPPPPPSKPAVPVKIGGQQ